MDKPLVSIHIITYNQIDFIHETLTTALEQDYENLEVIVADDGSTDGTAEVIMEYAAKYPNRLIPIVGGVNLGITGNSNRGLKACKGKYVAFQGGDDILYPGKISKQVAWMEADSERIICGHDVEVFDSKTRKILGIKGCGMPNNTGTGSYNIIKYGVASYYSGTSIMVRRDAIPDYGFDERLPVVSDWKFIIDCLATGGKYGGIEGIHAGYRKHGNSITDIGKEVVYKDCLITVGLLEAQYPEYVSICRLARVFALYQIGVFYLKTGDKNKGLRYLFASADNSSFFHKVWKYPVFYILTLLSPQNIEKVRKLYLTLKISLGLQKKYF